MRIHESKYAAIVSFREYTNSSDDSGNSLIQMSTGSMWIHQMTMVIHWYKYAALVSSACMWIHQMIMTVH